MQNTRITRDVKSKYFLKYLWVAFSLYVSTVFIDNILQPGRGDLSPQGERFFWKIEKTSISKVILKFFLDITLTD